MEKIELYNKTVDILVQAYFNDTLVHENCYACAVGNIIAANLGFEYEETNGILGWKGEDNFYIGTETVFSTNLWAKVFSSDGKEYKRKSMNYYCDTAKQQIDSTGYSVDELIKIEYDFEKGCRSIGDKMFNGLMAVIEVLDQIHNNTDNAITESSKAKFTPSLL